MFALYVCISIYPTLPIDYVCVFLLFLFFLFFLFNFFSQTFFLARELRGKVNCSIIEMLSCLFRAGSPVSV